MVSWTQSAQSWGKTGEKSFGNMEKASSGEKGSLKGNASVIVSRMPSRDPSREPSREPSRDPSRDPSRGEHEPSERDTSQGEGDDGHRCPGCGQCKGGSSASAGEGGGVKSPNDDSVGIVWKQAGATIVVRPGAPDPEAFRPRLSEDAIAGMVARKIEARLATIERLIVESALDADDLSKKSGSSDPSSGDGWDRRKAVREGGRLVAAIIADTECAPRSTNRRQLAEIGVHAPSSNALPVESSEVHHALWSVLYGLARLGIFVIGTNHLSDAALLKRLCSSVLEEEIADVPPTTEMSEFVDLGGGAFPESPWTPKDGDAGEGPTELAARLMDGADDDEGGHDGDDDDGGDDDDDDDDAEDGEFELLSVKLIAGGLDESKPFDAAARADMIKKFHEQVQEFHFGKNGVSLPSSMDAPQSHNRDVFLPRPYRGEEVRVD